MHAQEFIVDTTQKASERHQAEEENKYSRTSRWSLEALRNKRVFKKMQATVLVYLYSQTPKNTKVFKIVVKNTFSVIKKNWMNPI